MQLELLTYRLRKVSSEWIVNFTGNWKPFPSFQAAQSFISELAACGYSDADRVGAAYESDKAN